MNAWERCRILQGRFREQALQGEATLGTRHIVAVHIDGEYKVAQYGQWDGYPSGQGATVLDFLQNGDVAGLKRNLAKTYAPTEDDYRRMWAEVGHDIVASNGMVPWDKSEKFAKLYPSLHRNTGAEILAFIASHDGEDRIPLENQIAFVGDSLFCEWAYVIDFDVGTFEVFKGFNKVGPAPEGSRFHGIPWNAEYKSSIGETYYQVALAHSWNLGDLPSREDFLEAFKEPDEVTDADAAADAAQTR